MCACHLDRLEYVMHFSRSSVSAENMATSSETQKAIPNGLVNPLVLS